MIWSPWQSPLGFQIEGFSQTSDFLMVSATPVYRRLHHLPRPFWAGFFVSSDGFLKVLNQDTHSVYGCLGFSIRPQNPRRFLRFSVDFHRREQAKTGCFVVTIVVTIEMVTRYGDYFCLIDALPSTCRRLLAWRASMSRRIRREACTVLTRFLRESPTAIESVLACRVSSGGTQWA